MSKRNKFLAGLGVLAFVALVVWAVSTVPDVEKIVDKTDETRVMTYDDNTLSEEKDGRKIWELKAEHMVVNVDTQEVTLEKITGHFYAEDGRVVNVTADGGSYDNGTKDIAIKGNVDITTSDGAKLTSDELRWAAKEARLAAIGNATATKDDMKAVGEKIESTDGFNKIKITGKAHLVKGGNDK